MKKSALSYPLFSAALFGLGGLLATTGCSKAEAPKIEEVAPVKVQTADINEISAPESLRLTGSLRGARETDLAANVNGRVTATLVERGQEVKQGTVLAKVDTAAASLALAEARVAVATSKTQQEISSADCERYEQLKAKGAVTDLEYDQVTSKCKTAPLNLQAAQARQSIAAKNVGDGVIRAPFSGVVSERFVEVGEYVQAASKVVSIAQVDELRLEFGVPEANVAQVKVGSKVQFKVAGYPDQVFTGTVRFVSGAVRVATRDLMVEAVVDNPEKKLMPGMFADVALTFGEVKLPAVPKASVFTRLDKSRVYVLANGKVEERVLQTGSEVGDMLTVRHGVKAGDKLIIGEVSQLTNGQRAE